MSYTATVAREPLTRGMDIATRLMARVEKTKGCWIWIGPKNRGYGFLMQDGRRRLAHVVSYELVNGPVAAWLELDHLCRNTACVRPDHLEAVSHADNVKRWAASRTHCKHGHPLDETNTYHVSADWKRCRVCNAVNARRYRSRA